MKEERKQQVKYQYSPSAKKPKTNLFSLQILKYKAIWTIFFSPLSASNPLLKIFLLQSIDTILVAIFQGSRKINMFLISLEMLISK